ncbi:MULTISPECIES: helicase-related protein [Rhodococcus]|uniref:helicase-related protein n=1 Tax=Rhodococcus TaxID=1827 RepID=UPI0004C3C640|nr:MULTISPECIES: helicase-related protein [Rhodococcus]ANQ76036.1 NgoFVII family restriction endonuclease [Rhodococcus sp. 008]MCJ0901658.1 phospholipase D-like domain-containing protein [Rhodococcus sp. ARC_M13]
MFPVTRIFDNIHQKLGSHLQETLRVSERMDVAVGYFNLRGWSVFDSLVEDKAEQGKPVPVVRILIGMVMTGPQETALEELQAAVEGTEVLDADFIVGRERKAQLLEQLRTQLMRGLPTNADRAALQSLRDLLESKAVEIKVFTRRPLHGKAYIFHREDLNNPITGFVGSSNLTAPGLTHNYELNVDVIDTNAAEALAEWFEDRWTDKFSREVTADLLTMLDESWARKEPRRPYEVFLKVCYDLSRDVREGLAEYSVPAEVSSQLLEYQSTAVRTLARRIMTKQGTMLGDVVGLGKTLTAIAVALMLRDEHGYMPLVVCPKNLVKMWEEHFEAYNLYGRVVPYSMAHTILPDLRRYAFVIVDESHTLRNDERRDYKAIQEYIHANDSKTLLLTATPYNIRFRDVANQLSLYIDDDDDLGISPTNAMAADPRLIDKVDGKITTMAAFRKSEDPDDWKRLMSEHLVRRTRTFIKNNYSETDEDGRQYLEFSNGTRFTFPERIPKPVNHSFGPNDPAAIMSSDTTLDTLTNLVLPRYELGKYLKETAKLTDEEKEFVDNLNRGRGNVAGFVRTTFYKRLSSCGHSFTLSLQRHIARNELFGYAIDNGLRIPTGTIVDTSLTDDDDPTASDLDTAESLTDDPGRRYEALVASNPAAVTWIRPELFTTELRNALDRDTTVLHALLKSYGGWEVATDSKLDALIKLLTADHPAGKVLVFTEYKDTANYIAAALREAGISGVGLATGDSDDPTALAHLFSPRSNALPGHDSVDIDNELRVLIATDVLSEGQNLQDAHIVVNYDLPWAIIRLIQRAGRVDRVGQQSDEVLLYSFFHESVDNVISLRQRISDRLSANAEAFGSDEQFFGSEGEVQAIADLYNGTLDDQDSADDVDASSLAYQLWHQAQEKDPQLAARIAALPDMIDATRAKRLSDKDEGVICYVRTESGMDGFGIATSDGDTRLLTGHEVLRAFEATPEELGLEHREDHDELIEKLVRGPLATPTVAAGRLRGVRRTLWRRLGETLHSHDNDTEKALDELFQHPLQRDAENRLKRSVRNGASDDDLTTMIRTLHRDQRLVIATRTGKDPIRVVSSMGVTS